MAGIEVTLIGKPGCHLCDDARTVVSGVLSELGAGAGEGSDAGPAAPAVTLVERSILDDAELQGRYAEDIPVLMINGKVHTYWRVDPGRLRRALLEAQ